MRLRLKLPLCRDKWDKIKSLAGPRDVPLCRRNTSPTAQFLLLCRKAEGQEITIDYLLLLFKVTFFVWSLTTLRLQPVSELPREKTFLDFFCSLQFLASVRDDAHLIFFHLANM